MSAMKKYYKTRRDAVKALNEHDKYGSVKMLRIFKMPAGTRRAGQWAVCSEIEYLNTY